MDYTLKFIYKDEKTIQITVEDSCIDSFLETIKKNEIYWSNEERQQGFWVDIQQIRCIYIQRDEQGRNGEAQNRKS